MEIVTIGGLPVYNALVTDEGTGMFRISLVDDPAVQSNFLAFDEAKRVPLYAVSDEEKRLVLGVIMRSDFPIFRRDTGFGEYYVIYKPEEIRKMAEKYLAESRQNILNAMHQGDDLPDIYMVQYFIKGNGINPAGFEDIADGSLFAEFHVVNDDIWAEIKAGTYRGFSLEGVFDLEPERDLEVTKKIVDDLDGKFSNEEQPTKQNNPMTKLARLREKLARLLAEFGSVTTDRGILAWDGEEDLKAGDRVYIEDQDGARTDAPDGDYRTEDGKTIVVIDGAVAEIRDPEAEVAPEEENPAEENREDEQLHARRVTRFTRIREAFEQSYEETERKIWEAIAAKYADSYIVEAADTYAVAEVWDAESRYIRFAITLDADGNVTLGDEQEVKLMFVPVDFVYPFEKESESEDAAAEAENLRAENEALRAEVEQLKKMPAAKPAHEEVKAAAEVPVTGNKGLDRLAKLATAK